jgi:4-hydroxy-3-methylbut-2-enyl diphosphate reductase
MFLFLITGLRSIYMDLSDIAGDRMIGRDSMPIVFGEKRTWNVIRLLVVFLFILCYLSAYFAIIPKLGYTIGFWILIEYLILDFFVKTKSRRPSLIRRDLFVDGHFIAAGAVALLWNLL